jgi:transcriptional regulator with XRE-family HTH domain
VFVISTNFSRSLSFLRQEKGVSQRVAAQDLGVSQALLSHYENGIREPGFQFLLRACDYYNVSSDFLLGRTLSRDGTVILDVESLPDSSLQKEDRMISNHLALLSKRLVSNSVDLLFHLLATTKQEDAIRAACNYLGTAVYTLFRHLYQADGKNSQDIFSVPSQKFALSVAKVDMISSEMEYVEALTAHAKAKGAFPDLSNEALTRQHTGLYQSLLHIIHITGERINHQLSARKEC